VAERVAGDAHDTVARVARDSYGKLLAFLAIRTHDIAAAEDALADAFQAALTTWPQRGVPRNPEGWLLTAARRRGIDVTRRERAFSNLLPVLSAADCAAANGDGEEAFPDERLAMLFLCAHPAIGAHVRTPLMLQVVLGLDAARIGSAFLVAPATMGQRLSRAKAKIYHARPSFELPSASDLPARLGAVLQAIYAAYGSGWEGAAGSEARYGDLADEALALGRLLVSQLPGEPEAYGLLALMLLCEARRAARRDARGAYVPLAAQDPARWSRPLIAEGLRALRQAAQFRQIGRFQLEAAIQSVHLERAESGVTNHAAIVALYAGLLDLAPAAGVRVGYAAALAETAGAVQGWTALQHIAPHQAERYQPYWALAAHLLRLLGHRDEAGVAYDRAIALCTDAPTRAYLAEQRLG